MDNIIYFIKSTLSSDMAASGFPLIYKGEVNHNIMRSFAYMANRKIEEKKFSPMIRRRVFHILVECLQNITKHSDDYDKNEQRIGNGLFVVGYRKDAFYVFTGNLVQNEKLKALEDRLVQINSSDTNQLKKKYLKQMMEAQLSEKGGAGLGLIDIARKSGRKLFYHFVPYDNHNHFFLLAVTIPIEHDSNEEEVENTFNENHHG